jgi:hypothetical protein
MTMQTMPQSPVDIFHGSAVHSAATCAFLISALVCAVSSLRHRNRRRRVEGWNWLVLALLQTGYAFENQFRLRDMVAGVGRKVSHDADLYSDRRLPQLLVVVALSISIILTTALAIYLHRKRPRSLRLAIAGMGLITLIVFVDMVSYHYIDAVFHIRLGPASLCRWLWMVGGAMVITGASLSLGRQQRKKLSG